MEELKISARPSAQEILKLSTAKLGYNDHGYSEQLQPLGLV
jgi:hypothetical protein